jgi:hypothetical protein
MILLNAVAPGVEQGITGDGNCMITTGDCCLVDFIPADPSSMSAARRATYRLRGAGLIDTASFPFWGHRARKSKNAGWLTDGYASKHCLPIRLTPLGALVLDTFRRELETGRRIRWAKLDGIDGGGRQ